MRNRRKIVGVALAYWSIAASASFAADSLRILPGDFTLVGREGRQLLVVERLRDERPLGQVADGLALVSSNPSVVAIDGSTAVAVGDGQATISATAGELSAQIQVAVTGTADPFEWSFRNHVQPVLTKAGCNSGACHGAAAGKKGFKLSLRGFDPAADYFVLTHQARARRVNLADPGRSLMLTKPTGLVPHKGGVRFAVDSREYRIVSEWIAAGAPAPRDDDPRIERLEVLPSSANLQPGNRQQLIVRAHYAGGRVADVTRWAKFTSSDESVAQVDAVGLVNVSGNGECAVSAWCQSINVVASLSVPYPNAVPPAIFAASPHRNFIDELVLAKLAALNLPPSPPAGDGEFLRRVYLDTIGVLPTVHETRAFLADASADKRDRLIEHLLSRGEFVDYWTYKWCDLLLVNGEKLRPPAMWSYYHWIRSRVAAGAPWDEFARGIVTATGSTLENGAANFYVLHQDPLDLAETTSMAFLGMSINCARCHNHPLEKWTNDQYFAMANLYARVRTKDIAGDGIRAVYSVPGGDLIQPRTGKVRPPQPLDGVALADDATGDRREHLAAWLVSPENPYFARAITNRVWANFFGVGLVESVDDVRLTNPPSNPELLAAAARHLVENRYDLKSLMRAILQSQTYQRSSQPLAENLADRRFYSRYYSKRLMAEVLLDSLSQVTGVPTQFPDYATGWRATQLPDANVASYFLKSFGRPLRNVTCECERTAEPSMVQVLHLSNGDTLNQKLSAAGNRLEQLLSAGASDEAIVDEAYLAALCRPPTPDERTRLLQVLSSAGEADKRQAIEDLYWSILSSKEFLFNH